MLARNGEPLTIRSFEDPDRDAVFALYGEAFGPTSLERFTRRWEWQFLRNPAARIRPAHMWVAERRSEVVGYLASFPQRMKFLDEQHVIYHDCDLIVSPKARRQGIGQRLVEAYDRFPNPLSNCLAYAAANGRIRRRLGYRMARVVPRFFRPYDLSSIHRHLDESDRLPKPLTSPPFSWLVRSTARALTAAIVLFNRVRRPPAIRNYVTEQMHRAEPEFDRLWSRVSPEFPLLAVRDRAFVQWRFFDDPVHDHRVIVARDVHGELAGYLAYRISDRKGVRVAKIMDCFCSPTSSTVVEALLGACFRSAEGEAVGAVHCLGLHPAIRKVVRRYLYVAPPSLNQPAWLLWKGSDELRDVVYDPDNWHISHADSDIGFGA